MKHLQHIQGIELFKVLGDTRRLVILQQLMAKPATLSQLGQVLGDHPAKVRHHLVQLEQVGLVELVETQQVRGFVEKYYRASARAFLLNEIILPESAKPFTAVIIGSHDMALELLCEQVRKHAQFEEMDLVCLPVGSLDGLIALRQGVAHLAGCHLLDPQSGEYNLPYARHFFPDEQVSLITLAHREQGLMLAPGNPHAVNGLSDLARPQIRYVNRNKGSGTRIWLDNQLKQLGLPTDRISGYELEVRTHTQVAETIARGQAGAGLGLRAAAQHYNLDFIPLFQERFDLVTLEAQFSNPQLLPLLEHLQSEDFRSSVAGLAGYDATRTGTVVRT